MIALSTYTERLTNHLFPAAVATRIRKRLLEEVSENISSCGNESPRGMERIRFSVIRLIYEGNMNEDDIFRLAYIDWRDLFMAADHGHTEAHKNWAKRIIKQAAQQVTPADAAVNPGPSLRARATGAGARAGARRAHRARTPR
jgi:hypothetical protein